MQGIGLKFGGGGRGLLALQYAYACALHVMVRHTWLQSVGRSYYARLSSPDEPSPELEI